MAKSLNTFKELKETCLSQNKSIWEVTLEYEAELAETTISDIRTTVKRSLEAMKEAIKTGLLSKEMSISGMCGDDCDRLQKRFLVENSLFGKTF